MSYQLKKKMTKKSEIGNLHWKHFNFTQWPPSLLLFCLQRTHKKANGRLPAIWMQRKSILIDGGTGETMLRTDSSLPTTFLSFHSFVIRFRFFFPHENSFNRQCLCVARRAIASSFFFLLRSGGLKCLKRLRAPWEISCHHQLPETRNVSTPRWRGPKKKENPSWNGCRMNPIAILFLV